MNLIHLRITYFLYLIYLILSFCTPIAEKFIFFVRGGAQLAFFLKFKNVFLNLGTIRRFHKKIEYDICYNIIK